jgi:Flp pilus assembly pilin Flp
MVREDGQDLIEYALLGGLIAAALVAVGVLLALTNGVTDMANGIGDCIDFDNATACP